MVNLVSVIDGEPRTTSDLVGKEFGLAHKHVLEKIYSFMAEIPAVRARAVKEAVQAAAAPDEAAKRVAQTPERLN